MEKPSLYLRKGQDLPLSGTALVELMREVLAKGKLFRFQARGWSMSPFIRDGDVVTVSPLKNTKPGLGEVSAFVDPETGGLVIHRIIGKDQRFLLIRGDNLCGGSVDRIPLEKIIGRLIEVERLGKKVRLGLGPERYGIAFFSRMGFFSFASRWYGKIKGSSGG